MPNILKWQSKEVALYQSESADEASPENLIGSVELDFDLGPIALTLDEDRHRLLAVLAQLHDTSELKDSQVDLIIPEAWGVTHRIPDPGLSDEDLTDHIRWEITKALIDSEDQYRFSYGCDDEGGIVISALRNKLLDPIIQVIQGSGFTLNGLYFEGEPWQIVNIIGGEAIKSTSEADQDEAAKPRLKRDYRRSGQSKFFTIIAVIGVIIFAVFIYWKMTTEKKPELVTEPVAQVHDTAPARIDTSSYTGDITPRDESGRATESTSPAPPQYKKQMTAGWTDMSSRLELLNSTLALFSSGDQFDLISFTENLFIGQFTSSNQNRIEILIGKVKSLPNIKDVKTSVVPPLNSHSRGTVSGTLFTQGRTPVSKPPVKEELIVLGKKHKLQNKGLIFTGSQQFVLGFLNEVAANGYSIYRVIIMPWGEDNYRVVLEL